MSNHNHGQQAEQRATEYLEQIGYKILQRNWRTRFCEIDIVAQKATVVFLVEVKYRQSSAQGYGSDYITPNKLKQMSYAAELWVQDHDWSGDYRLAVVSVDAGVISFIDDVF